MAQRLRRERKTYAMQRMAAAISRAIESDLPAEKDRAALRRGVW